MIACATLHNAAINKETGIADGHVPRRKDEETN